jgi:hypothetical protein
MNTHSFLFRPVLNNQHRAISLVLGLLFVLNSGCASMYNPLAPSFSGEEHQTIKGCKTPDSYNEGMECAHDVREAYLKAAVENALFSDRLATLLIPASAAALGLGISGGSTNAILGLSLGTATGVGLGSWFSSQPRREAFGLGAEAISCVIKVSTSLNVPAQDVNFL